MELAAFFTHFVEKQEVCTSHEKSGPLDGQNINLKYN